MELLVGLRPDPVEVRREELNFYLSFLLKENECA